MRWKGDPGPMQHVRLPHLPHPNLTTRKSFYVEISRARDRAELVTDDRARLKEQLEAATGERIPVPPDLACPGGALRENLLQGGDFGEPAIDRTPRTWSTSRRPGRRRHRGPGNAGRAARLPGIEGRRRLIRIPHSGPIYRPNVSGRLAGSFPPAAGLRKRICAYSPPANPSVSSAAEADVPLAFVPVQTQ